MRKTPENPYYGEKIMKIETIAIHGGYQSEPTTRAAVTPIYQTTSYTFEDTQHGADLFDLKVEGNIYTRIMNPTTAVLEKRVAEMEGGIGALALSSGMAAITYAVLTIAENGDNIVSTSRLYGGTYNLFAHTLPRLGIGVRFADDDDIAPYMDENTKAVFCESLGNPAGNITDLQAMADTCHRRGVPLIVDNTVPTPCLCRPFEHGADIVVHSLTKYMGGHGSSIGGIIVGFAAKDLLANFFGGLMIYLDRPFTEGDWIRSPDREIEGTVEYIGWRLTRIRTFDQRPLYIPNSAFANIAVENPSRMSHRRINEAIGVRYDDIGAVPAIVDNVKRMLREHPAIDAEKTLIVNLNEFSASSVDILIYAYTGTTDWSEFHAVKQSVLMKVHEIVAAHGAEIAFPTTTVHLAGGTAREG